MGVPAFVRWLRDRYPRIIGELIEHDNISEEECTHKNPNGIEFDNLYLDMNGIIHNCSHPENRKPPSNEEEMLHEIRNTIDRMFSVIRPRNLLYIAIDGVAPRAKMNQQRSRRFVAAKERAQRLLEQEKRRKEGKDVDTDMQNSLNFDSNCITPGTLFMSRVASYLRDYVDNRVANHRGWQTIKVLFSDASVPGEGEHKIVHFIRTQRTLPNYNPNLSHVIYGLDADLVMLGLATHETHFYILRDKVIFDKCFNCGKPGHMAQDCVAGEENDEEEEPANARVPFELLELPILRKYLEYEFVISEGNGMELERVIDDFIFLCFLVGNDFLPHMPTLRIREGALDLLIHIYKQLFPTMNCYITDNGNINYPMVRRILWELSKHENTIIMKRIVEEKRRKELELRKKKQDKILSGVQTSFKKANQYESLEEDAQLQEEEEEESDVEDDDVRYGESGWKERYLLSKFGTKQTEDLAKTAKCYLEGLAWVLQYYYRGCSSWNWYYQYHYALFAQDILDHVKVEEFSPKFELGEPFHPLVQLMAVLPPRSASLLPVQYQKLMLSEDSSIIDFYPIDFKIDLNGKKETWQGVALLPFIDEARLLSALKVLDSSLTAEEKQRNSQQQELLVVSNLSNFAVEIKRLYQPEKRETSLELTYECKHGISGIVKAIQEMAKNQSNWCTFALPSVEFKQFKNFVLEGGVDPPMNITEWEIATDIQRISRKLYSKGGLGIAKRKQRVYSSASMYAKVDPKSKGYELLSKMGWKGGRLGQGDGGMLTPVDVTANIGTHGLSYNKELKEIEQEYKSQQTEDMTIIDKPFFNFAELSDLLTKFDQDCRTLGKEFAQMKFPPGLDAATRKQLHHIAAKLQLKSKSYGNGIARHIVITYMTETEAARRKLERLSTDTSEEPTIQVENIEDTIPEETTVDEDNKQDNKEIEQTVVEDFEDKEEEEEEEEEEENDDEEEEEEIYVASTFFDIFSKDYHAVPPPSSYEIMNPSGKSRWELFGYSEPVETSTKNNRHKKFDYNHKKTNRGLGFVEPEDSFHDVEMFIKENFGTKGVDPMGGNIQLLGGIMQARGKGNGRGQGRGKDRARGEVQGRGRGKTETKGRDSGSPGGPGQQGGRGRQGRGQQGRGQPRGRGQQEGRNLQRGGQRGGQRGKGQRGSANGGRGQEGRGQRGSPNGGRFQPRGRGQ